MMGLVVGFCVFARVQFCVCVEFWCVNFFGAGELDLKRAVVFFRTVAVHTCMVLRLSMLCGRQFMKLSQGQV